MTNTGNDSDPGPVMTFLVGNEWLAVRVEQMERVALATRLWQVPLSWPGYLGLLDNGHELVLVLHLTANDGENDRENNGQNGRVTVGAPAEQLVVILQVRGEAVGLAIGKAGRLCSTYELAEKPPTVPAVFAAVNPRFGYTLETRFWLIDTDRLWHKESNTTQPPA